MRLCLITSPENRFIVRDFVYTDELALKHQQELELAGTTERELWVRPLLIQIVFQLIVLFRRNSYVSHGRTSLKHSNSLLT